ncbi:hypothetical protein [Mucilaginibacter sp.]|uniref:hypothetical protein n=1 Tax=Mucilaginibacter sp. TaxID=1882438 RepID=UPI003D0EF099
MKRYVLLVIPVILFCFSACKKDAAQPQATVTLVGKWYLTQHNLTLISNGVQVGSSSKTSYTTNDYAQYFNDGTGILSANSSSSAPSLSTFRYTLNGTTIIQTSSNQVNVTETITKLTATALSIHYETLIGDPVNSSQIDTEIDDYDFKR